MSNRKAIEAKLVELKGQLERVEGKPTEVYSRIVGYYRSVRNWNAGKREEYGQRLAFAMPSGPKESAREECRPAAQAGEAERREKGAPAQANELFAPEGASLRDGVLVFTRESCPNCPPVANYVQSSGIKAVFVDVDREEGLALARDLGVMATPTVLGMDAQGREAFRAFDIGGLRAKLELSAGAQAPRA